MNILNTLAFVGVLFFPTPAIAATTTATTTPTAIVEASEQALPPILEKIAWCESHNNPLAKNKNSSASGRFQFLWGSWHYYGLKYWGDDYYKKNIWDYEEKNQNRHHIRRQIGGT